MLTIRKISLDPDDLAAALIAAEYTTEERAAPEDFARSENAETYQSSVWLGSESALEKLGLTRGAEVIKAELALAMMGLNTQTEERVRQPGYIKRPALDRDGHPELNEYGEPFVICEPRINNFDLTFSAPKSVASAWTQADAKLRAEIETLMLEAADAALQYILTTRDVVSQTDPAKGFAAALSLDVLARRAEDELVPSPQLHVHGILVGVERADGALLTPQVLALYQNKGLLEGGAVGRLVLAEGLAKLGFQIEWATGPSGRYFEIAGVPKELIKRWSGRTREVEREALRRELLGGEKLTNREKAELARITRMAKEEGLFTRVIMDQWDEVAESYGFDQVAVAGLRRLYLEERSLEQRKDDVWGLVEERFKAQGPTVVSGEARSIIFECSAGRLSLDEANGLIDERTKQGRLVALAENLVTTRPIRQAEINVMERMVAAALRPREELDGLSLNVGIGSAERRLNGFRLDGEQLSAINTLTSGAGISMLSGLGGTGKGDVLHAVATAHRAAGFSVLACAVDGATTRRLAEQTAGEAYTLEQLLYAIENGKMSVNRRSVIMIDEASKIGLALWERLSEVIERCEARLVLAGHDGQHGAIELPGMFSELLEREPLIPVAELTEIRRHRDPNDPSKLHPWLGDYQRALNEGTEESAAFAVKLLRDHGAITLHDNHVLAIRATVDSWDAHRREWTDPKAAAIIVHGSNDDVDLLNVLAQGKRRANGELRGKGVRAIDRDYLLYRGDVVMLRERSYLLSGRKPGNSARAGGRGARRVENGTLGLIERIDTETDRVWVRLSEPEGERVVEINQAAIRAAHERGERVPTLRLAYAHHTYTIQGATVQSVDELGGHWSEDKEGAYVAGTRPRFRLHFHHDRESLGTANDEEECFRTLARRFQRVTTPKASIHFGRSAERIARRYSASAALPERATITERSRKAPKYELIRGQISIQDPLNAFAELFGEVRLAHIASRADQLAELAASADQRTLRRERERGFKALGRLNKASAHKVIELEAKAKLLTERIAATSTTAQRHSERADQIAAIRAKDKDQRKALHRGRAKERRAAYVQRGTSERDQRLLANVEVRLDAIHGANAHPEDWVKGQDGERFARAIAAARELALRVEIEAEQRLASLREDPSALRDRVSGQLEDPFEIFSLIGQPPERHDPTRGEWDALFDAIVRPMLVAQIEQGGTFAETSGVSETEAASGQRGQERDWLSDRDLATWIERWRAQIGMEPLAASEAGRFAEQDGGMEVPGW